MVVDDCQLDRFNVKFEEDSYKRGVRGKRTDVLGEREEGYQGLLGPLALPKGDFAASQRIEKCR